MFIKGILIIAAKRTPFGTFGGKFVNKSAGELLVTALKAALSAGQVTPTLVDSVIIGNVTAVRNLLAFDKKINIIITVLLK